jgi:hypothetical protein
MGSVHANVPLHISEKIAPSSIANTTATSMDIVLLNFRSRGACVKTGTRESIVSIWNASIIAHIPTENATAIRENAAATLYTLHITEPMRGQHGKVSTAVICHHGQELHHVPYHSRCLPHCLAPSI